MKKAGEREKHLETVLPEKNNTKKKKTAARQTDFRKLISVEMTCCCFVMASCKKCLNIDSRAFTEGSFLYLKQLNASLVIIPHNPHYKTSARQTRLSIILNHCQGPGRIQCTKHRACAFERMSRGLLALTPNHEVSGRLVDAPGVARHAGVGPGVGDVGRGDEQAARLEQGEPGQLDRTAGQHALALSAQDEDKTDERERRQRKR